MEGFAAGDLGTGSAYEAERTATRARLAADAVHRRVDLGQGLVVVFANRETVRTALQELLRAERISDTERIAMEAAAFAELLGDDHDLVATLFIDVADPVALADRVGELPGIAGAVSLDVEGKRVPAVADSAEGVSGAFHLRFALSSDQRGALIDGAPVTVLVDHPSCRASATLGTDQVRAIAADLRR